MDVHSVKTRSYNMSCIKEKNTKPEEKVRKYLFSHGFRYRKNVKKLSGSPDIVLAKYRTIVFVNGCFWHIHDCDYFVWPKSNIDFWKKKLSGNKIRDSINYKKLQENNWKVLIVWECELKKKNFDKRMEILVKDILSHEKS